MNGLVTTPFDPAQRLEAEATLNNFKVNLFGFVIMWFEEPRFVAEKGEKPDVAVRLRAGRRRGAASAVRWSSSTSCAS